MASKADLLLHEIDYLKEQIRQKDLVNAQLLRDIVELRLNGFTPAPVAKPRESKPEVETRKVWNTSGTDYLEVPVEKTK